MQAEKSRLMHRGLSVLIMAIMVAALAGCAAPRQKTSSRGIGKPPPEQGAIVYRQKRSEPLITPEADPFAVH